jgi:hypothetical protein
VLAGRTYRTPRPTELYAIVGLLAIAAYLAVLLYAMRWTSYDIWGGIALVPVLVVVSLPVLRRQAASEADPTAFRFLLFALVVKFGGCFLRYYVGLRDANVYSKFGSEIAEGFRHGDFATGLPDLTGTQFIRFFTGVIYTGTGTTKLGGCVVYAWLGFWGLFLFYRAFVRAVPEGRRRTYGWLVFFLPSLVFWPSSIGKDAWMTFSLGLAVYGIALLLQRWSLGGIAALGLGLWFAWLVRGHLAAIVAIAFVAAVVARRGPSEHRELAPLFRGLALAVVLLLALAVGLQAAGTLDVGEKGIVGALVQVEERTSTGGSDFEPYVADNPIRFPMAAVTVMFRPFLFEAHNTDARIAALESTALILLFLVRWRWVWAAVRSWRRQPYVVFCLAYVVLFVIAFSSFANFGLLARQRVQLLPILLVFLAIPPPPTERRRRLGSEEPVPETASTLP